MEASRCFDDVPGTVIALPSADDPNLAHAWVIGTQLSENVYRIQGSDMTHGLGPLFADGKLECRCQDDRKRGLMRIYLQVPHSKTEFRTPARRAEQAVALPGHAEINGMKEVHRIGSTAAPKLLALCQAKQSDTGIVPGGYFDHLVWEKVPGESMDTKKSWELPEKCRTDIRSKFKALFRQISMPLY